MDIIERYKKQHSHNENHLYNLQNSAIDNYILHREKQRELFFQQKDLSNFTDKIAEVLKNSFNKILI